MTLLSYFRPRETQLLFLSFDYVLFLAPSTEWEVTKDKNKAISRALLTIANIYNRTFSNMCERFLLLERVSKKSYRSKHSCFLKMK
jgi:hypothetical protein